MKNSQIRLVVVLGLIAIMCIVSVQFYWLRKAYDIKERQFTETIHTALQNVADNLANINDGVLGNEDIISQLSSDYFVVNINDVIDANTLEYYLRNEFEKFQVNLDFEYAIYDCGSHQMVYGNYVKLEDNNREEEISTYLPTYDEYTYYFGVYFPTKSNFVINNLRLSLVFSLILLLAVVFFSYAIYVILQQKRLSELQTDFINNMTHEFKTPISSISLSAEAMLKAKEVQDSLRLTNYTKIIKEQTDRLNLQVEKVLQIAHLEANDLVLKPERIDLVDLLHTVIRGAKLNYEKLHGTIELNCNLSQCYITADKTHLTNILHNLLDNSLKYNNNVPKAIFSLSQNQQGIVLSLKDNGIGIDDKYLKQLFDKFFRVPTGNVHNVKGFGLGLFYVKQVIDKHNWQIKLESKLHEGTEIKICI
ncbi:MAG: HAMP domain-containing histidine kinase [Chitinophagales bacterium]|nr:HAMP domain-containing histidine kinase [Bacteroidota bacterium]MCB9257132.1 HAMP domain-containing histidine kinase [Chitinophagales bacterium]